MARIWQAAEPLDPAAWIPITALALEGLGKGTSIEQRTTHLTHNLADDILADDIGRLCVPRSVARELFALRNENLQRTREQARATSTELAAESQRTRQRVRAIAEQQRHQEPTGDPLADLKREDYEADWDNAANLRNELTRSDATGNLEYHPIRNN